MRFPLSARTFLLASISPLAISLTPVAALAAETATEVGELVVTATRRDSTVQDAPVNIAAVGQEQIEEQGIQTVGELAAIVPGLTVVNQGSRGDSPIIVRGLNANPLAAAEALSNDGGGTVATYVGEIPFYIQLRLEDLQRVEVLLGPQGTLYGAGTLAGAIRYIPNRPQFDAVSGSVRASVYNYAEGSGLSNDVGFTLNLPLSDTFAIRASVDSLHDLGFIDYPFVVNTVGVSDPDPDFSNPADVAANTHRVEDVNHQTTLSSRLALRWRPSDRFDANLSWFHQDQETGGRQISSARSTVPGVGQWESALRVEEPLERTDDLVALEMTLGLGFAELTSATGWSRYTESGQRDQTDLLITLEYTYDDFPTFTAFTLDTEEREIWSQELRLVSTHEGPFSWIVGGFYNHFESFGESREFTPFFDAFLGTSRPDALEYYNVVDQELTETAAYGELSYQITEAWQVTVGGRYYRYDLQTRQAVDFPLLRTLFGDPPDSIVLDFDTTEQENSGFLFKFNTSYRFSERVLGYFTVSQGYRIGNSNGLEPCTVPPSQTQTICGQPDELEYQPDKTTNYELGLHSEWFDGRLRLNGAIYYIDWEDPQVLSATLIGLQPITRNAAGARSIGVELAFWARPTERLSLSGSYSYTNAELTEFAPNLVPTLVPPGFQSTVIYLNGNEGDRLPGSPEHKGSFRADYTVPAYGGEFTFSYGFNAQGNVLSRVGGLGGGLTLGGFWIHNIQLAFERDNWTAALYVNNLANEFAETGARSSLLHNQIVTDADGGDVHVRSFFTYVAPPRVIGIRLSARFGGP